MYKETADRSPGESNRPTKPHDTLCSPCLYHPSTSYIKESIQSFYSIESEIYIYPAKGFLAVIRYYQSVAPIMIRPWLDGLPVAFEGCSGIRRWMPRQPTLEIYPYKMSMHLLID